MFQTTNQLWSFMAKVWSKVSSKAFKLPHPRPRPGNLSPATSSLVLPGPRAAGCPAKPSVSKLESPGYHHHSARRNQQISPTFQWFQPSFSIRVYVHELAVTGNDLPPPRLETACQTLQGGHFFHVQQALKLARLDMDLFKRPFCSEAIGCSPTNLAAFR